MKDIVCMLQLMTRTGISREMTVYNVEIPAYAVLMRLEMISIFISYSSQTHAIIILRIKIVYFPFFTVLDNKYR